MRYDNILETVGNTPLVRLHSIARHLSATLWGKCEFQNPGGSVKDRIAYRMILEAEKEGRIQRGDTIIEPTSGNTGVGLALAGAAMGYRVIITMPEKMSREKQVVLEALGAEVIRTPTEAAWDDPDSHISVANRLAEEIPNAHVLDQYKNPANPLAHYEGTAQEIWDELEGQVDMVVLGAGTGGTVTGVAKRLKELNPDVRIVGVDPVGSILAGPGEVHPYKVEGIGYDFIPEVLERELVDQWVKVDDRNSFITARRLIREEGLLVGGSSGTATWAALQAARELETGQNCVVLLPDSVRNYLSKFVDETWMRQNHFYSASLGEGTVEELMANAEFQKRPPLVTLSTEAPVKQAVKTLRMQNISQVPIVRAEDDSLVGILGEEEILAFLADGGDPELACERAMDVKAPRVTLTTSLSTLHETVVRHEAAVIVTEDNQPLHIVTRIDLLDYLTLPERTPAQQEVAG